MTTLTLWPGSWSCLRYPHPPTLPPDFTSAVLALLRDSTAWTLLLPQDLVPLAPPPGACQHGFRVLEMAGPLPFHLTGILAPIATCLAAAGVPILALSTFDTDLVLVPQAHLENACLALANAGYQLHP